MSIMNKIFGNRQPEHNPVAQQQQPQQPQNPQGNQQQSLNPANPQKPKSPMDDFEDLFKMKEDNGNNQQNQEDPNAPYFALDPTKLQEQASKMDFFQGAEDFEETARSALGGDINAMRTLLNNAAQRAYTEGAKFSAQVSNRVTKTGIEKTKQSLPKEMKSFLSESKTFQKDPRYNNPALKPIVNAVRQQVEQQFPDASEEEIVDYTHRFLTAQAEFLTSKSDQQNNSSDPTSRQPANGGQQDFSKFFNS